MEKSSNYTLFGIEVPNTSKNLTLGLSTPLFQIKTSNNNKNNNNN